VLKELTDMDIAIQKANEKMMFLASDKEILRQYDMREMAQIDYNSGVKKARNEGIAEVARNMIADGEPNEKIMRYTGFTLKDIERLRIQGGTE
jgi:predicted transposase/invertase (TIGR01784 family)